MWQTFFIPVWAYERGTFSILTCPESDANSFPMARGTMMRTKNRLEMYGVGSTFKTVSVGPRKAHTASRCTIVTVMG